ncbi:unnamed protein product [Brassica napus]|uniref:(rape) hypothetical protein n=1 Tax=Brassica napus TaxID=3708 RepID=A0A816JRP1_BRANA|nr:unnamed protein product [Brassica napus]
MIERRLANVRSKIYKLFGAYKKNQRNSSAATTSQGETHDVPAGYGHCLTTRSQETKCVTLLERQFASVRRVSNNGTRGFEYTHNNCGF